MERIEGQVNDQEELAKQVLSWIICAKRPLTTVELEHAIAVEVGELELDEENIPQIEDMVSVCAGLVTIDKESKIVRLVHYTAQEYFERTQREWLPNAEDDITTTCASYLSFSVFESGLCQTDKEFKQRLESHKLYDYAAHNWGHHAREASTLNQEVISFLKCKAKVEASSQALMAVKRYPWHSNYSQEVPRHITDLHLMAYFGINEATIILLKQGQGLDLKDSYGQTPLSYAAKGGHEAVVNLLLETGKVDVDSKDSKDRTPLWYAAKGGHEAVVKLLLETGRVDVDSKDSRRGQTPLSYAAE